MKVLFFAQSRQLAGCDETVIEADRPINSAELWDRLTARFSALAPLRRTTRLARNQAYLGADEMLQPRDEIAVIPPVSGG